MASQIPLVKYQHMENARTKLGSLRATLSKHSQSEAEWVAMEKIDGANFQFCTDGGSITCASRSRILGEADLFHNYQSLRERYRDAVLSAYSVVGEYALDEFTVVRLYGEIFGGKYPVRKAKKSNTCKHTPNTSVNRKEDIQLGNKASPDKKVHCIEIQEGCRTNDTEEEQAVAKDAGTEECSYGTQRQTEETRGEVEFNPNSGNPNYGANDINSINVPDESATIKGEEYDMESSTHKLEVTSTQRSSDPSGETLPGTEECVAHKQETEGRSTSSDRKDKESSTPSGSLVSKPVQPRVWYLPYVDYYLFDVSYETSDQRHLYLEVDQVVELAARCGFAHVATPLHRGTLDQLLTLDPAFPTSIPPKIGLDPLPGNLAEGYVLRTAKNIVLEKIDGKIQTTSLRYKMKQPAFEETSPEGAKQKIKEKVRAEQLKVKDNVKNKKIVLDEPQQVLMVELLAGFTQNRVISILSKHDQGQGLTANHKRLAAMLVDDVIEELNCDRDDLCDLLTSLDKEAVRKVKGAVFMEAVNCVDIATKGITS